MRRPRITRRVLRGIQEMGAAVSAGDEHDLRGEGGPEARAAYDDAMRAYSWACAMERWLDQRNSNNSPR